MGMEANIMWDWNSLESMHHWRVGLEIAAGIFAFLAAIAVLLSGAVFGSRVANLERQEKREMQNVIDDLEDRANIIHSLELHVSIEGEMTGYIGRGIGLSSAVALFDHNDNRFRFVTDPKFEVHQVTSKRRRILLVYESETPTQILGRPITFLHSMKTFVCDYSTFLHDAKIRLGNSAAAIDLLVILNGVPVLEIRDHSVEPGFLQSQQLKMEVGRYFQQISERYRQKVTALK